MFDATDHVEGFAAKRSLGYLLRRSFKLMSQQAEHRFAGRDLTLSQWIVLKMIDEGVATTPGEAARLLGHNTGATTRLVDQLESRGLLERRREAEDRRVVSLILTPAGKTKAKAWEVDMQHFFDDLLAVFSPDEVTVLIDLLGRLVERLEMRDSS
ncbi:MAG TPA: MarR family transcriptional regulator [Caulobacteraceae bacterium]|jgi:DNA-binding MarR family transcriptional regulator